MSDTIPSCQICDTSSDALRICINCRQPCCKDCLESHKTNKICHLITMYVDNFSNLCKHSNGLHCTGYCLKCSTQVCTNCQDSHADHLKSIVPMKSAMKPIKDRLQTCKKIYRKKETGEENLIFSLTEEMKKLRNVEMEIKDERMKWKQLIANIKHTFLQQVANRMAMIEEICEKGNKQHSFSKDMINTIDALLNVNSVGTFYPIWHTVIKELESIEDVDKIPECGTFSLVLNTLPDLSYHLVDNRNQKTLLEDHDRLRKKVRALEKQNYELKNDAREQKDMFDKLANVQKKVETEINEIRISNISLKDEKDKLEEKLRRIKNEREDETHAFENLKMTLQDNEHVQKKVETLEKQIQEMKTAYSNLSAEKEIDLGKIKSDNEEKQITWLNERDHLLNKVNELEEQIHEIQVSHGNLSDEKEKLTVELQRIKNEESHIEQKNREIKSLEQQFEKTKMELKRDIEQKSEENKQLAQNIQYLKKDLKETQLALNVVSLDKEEMDKSIQDILRHWSDESDNITKCMDQFETTTDMIEFLKNKIDQLKGLASMKDTPAILQSLNLLRDSVMQLQSDEEISHDRTNTATDAKSGQAVVDFVIKHIFGMNEKLRDLEHKVGENKQLEQHVQQLKRELEDRKLASRDIEKKIGENKRLEQNIQQLKDELEKSKLASSELSIEKEMIDRSIEDLLMIWSHESDNITKPIDQFETLMEKIEFLKNKIDQLKSLNSLAERVKETEMCSSGNGVMDKEVFMKDTPEILQSLNLLRESVMQLQSAEDRAHARTSIATDTKSGLAVGDFVMKHIFGMNEKLIKLESELNVEIEKRTDLIHKGATEAVITRDTKYKDEMEAKTVMLEKLENSNFNLDEKIKDLQAQILQCKQQNRKIAEENHIFCKERDELKNRVKSMEKLFNEKENEFSRMSAAVANINKSVAEKQKQIIVIQEDRDNKKHAIHELQSQLKQMQKTVLDLQRMNAQQKGLIQNQEEIISTVRCEKDELQTRLSSVAGEKLTKGNPSITDLGDPNRPMKISEKYGELYDNEWTDAMDNNKAVKECYKELADSGIEEIIIHHLHRLLKCCYKECLAKADEQIQTLGKAFAETMCLTFDSEEEILSLPVCKEASMFRRAKSVDFAKLLFENKMLCRNVMDDWNYNYKNEKVMQLLMTSSFFEKCVYICWSMAIQDPVMYLDEDVQAETQIDKNTYKEFVKSGNTVAFVVWPALFLHKDGPLLYKGVVQAYWK